MFISSQRTILKLLALMTAFILVKSDCSGAESTEPAVQAPSQATRPGLVVVVRGLGGYWPGCDNFCQRVRQYGQHVVSFTPSEAQHSASQIASEVQAGWWNHIRVVGYSYGGDAAIRFAHEMRRYGIQVERLILVEATTPGDVPDNVGYCFNVYKSRPRTDWLPVFRGVRVRVVPSATYLVNYDVTKNNSRLNRLNHFNFPTDQQLQELVAYQAGAPSQGDSSAQNTAQATENQKR